MITAIVKNRRGDVVRGPYRFQTEDAFDDFVARTDAGPSRFNERVERVESVPSFEEGVQLDLLQALALNANGVLKHFQMDRDFHQRLKNRKLTSADIKILADTLREAADGYQELAERERLGDQRVGHLGQAQQAVG